MCYLTEFDCSPCRPAGLTVQDFYVRFSGINISKNEFPVVLTLVFPPRCDAELFIDGAKIAPNSHAFLTLHLAAGSDEGEAVFRSRQRVAASGALPFQILFKHDKFLRGAFRKRSGVWIMRSYYDGDEFSVSDAAEVCVKLEDGHVFLSKHSAINKTRQRSCSRSYVKHRSKLEVIREEEYVYDLNHYFESEYDEEEDGDPMSLEMDLGTANWAVDIGVWALCLGLGLLVSRASKRRWLRFS